MPYTNRGPGYAALAAVFSVLILLISGLTVPGDHAPRPEGGKDIEPAPARGTSGGADAPSAASGTGTRGSTKVIMTTGFEFANDHDFPMNYPLWEVRDDNPQNGTDFWDDSTARSHNGARSMYCGDNGTGPAFGYDNGMTAWMTYGPFNLTNATQAHLKFWYWFDLDEGNDTLGFYGSPNGTSFTGFYFPGQNSSGWQYYSYDLSNYTGQEDSLCGEPQAWVAFRFFSNGAIAGNESYEGAYIDDVTIDEYTNLPPDAAGLNVTGDRWRVVDPAPTLNWTFLDTDTGDSQTARHIQVGDDSNWGDTDGIGGGPAEMWDGNATSTANTAVYAGLTMADGTTYHARVKVRDADLAWSNWTEFSFATNDPPSDFTITEPAAGAIVNGSIGNFAYVNWTIPANDDYGTDDNITVNLSYSDDGGQTWNSISDGENNTGSYLVNISLSLESSEMLVRVTAWDGYEERTNTSSLFTVDSKPPVFNDIKVFSNTSWYFVSKKAPTSLMVFFNSLAGQGANQQLGIRVNWSDASRKSLTGFPAFGDNPTDDDSNPNLVNYTIETNALMTTVELKIMDHFGRINMMKIAFYDDNLPPNVPTQMDLRPDSIVDTPGAFDDDQEFFMTWTNGTDQGKGSGLNYSLVWLDSEMPTPRIPPRKRLTTTASDETVTGFIRHVDNVGNVGTSINKTMTIDLTAPGAPVLWSETHPDDATWYSGDRLTFIWDPPEDLTNTSHFNWVLDKTADTEPAENERGTEIDTTYNDPVDGEWYFHVRAADEVAHWGPAAHMKVKIDTTPPGADDLSDAAGTTGDPVTFRTTLTDTHAGVSGAKVNWRYEGGTTFTASNMTEVSGSPGEYEWTLDAPENSTAGLEYYITVYDLAVPSNEGRLPADGESTILITDNDAPAMAQVTGDGTGTTGEPFTVNVTAFDNIVPVSARIYLDGIITGVEMTTSGGTGNMASYSTDVAIAQDSVAARTYHVVVRDEAGNELRLPETDGTYYTINVIDNDPPVFEPEESSASAYAAPDDPLRLFALAEDNIGVAAITAVIDTGSGEGSTMDLEEGSGDIFETFITASGSFGFHFEAADATGNVALLPAEGSFTVTVPLITLTQPAEGETVSDIVEVAWTVEGIDPDEDEATFSLQLSTDGGDSWEELKGSVSLSKGASNAAGVPTGIWDWSTHEHDDGEYVIRVTGTFGESPDDVEVSSTSGTFTLDNMDPPALVVDEPREGGKYSGTIEIEYTATDPDPGDTLTVDMEYMLEGGSWTALLTDGENTGSFTWKTRTEEGALDDGMYHLRVTVTDDSDRALIAVVEVGPFRVRNQDPPELSFGGTEGDELGDEYVVQWTAEDPEGDEVDVDLYYSKEGGEWVTIAEDEENDGSYTWDTSGLEPGSYRLKLVATDTSDRETELETPGLTKTAVAGEEKESEGADDNSMMLLLLLLVIAVIAVVAIAGAMSGAKKKRLAREKAEKEEADRKAEEERVAAEEAAAQAAAAQAAATASPGMPPEHLVGPYGAAGPEHTLAPAQYAPPEPPPVPDSGMQPPQMTAPDGSMQPAMTPPDQGGPPAMTPPDQGAQPPAMEPPDQGAQPPAMEPPEPGADAGGGIRTGSGALSAAESSLFDDF